MDQCELVPRGRRGLDDVGHSDDASLDESRVNQLVFAGGKHVRPDIELISGRVDELEQVRAGRHAAFPRQYRQAASATRELRFPTAMSPRPAPALIARCGN